MTTLLAIIGFALMFLAWPISECAFDFVQSRRRRRGPK